MGLQSLKVMVLALCLCGAYFGPGWQALAQTSAEVPALPGVEVPLPPEVSTDTPALYQDETPAPESQKIQVVPQQKTKETAVFDVEQDQFVPLFVEPSRNGIQFGHQEIDFDLTDPALLRLGPLVLSAEEVNWRLTRELRPRSVIDIGFGSEAGSSYFMSFQWPVNLVAEGTLEILDDQGRVLWRQIVSEASIVEWRKQVLDESSGNAARLRRVGHSLSSFGLRDSDAFQVPFWAAKKPLRFCVTRDTREARIAVCSRRYLVALQGGVYSLQPVNRRVVAKVWVNDKPVSQKGVAIFLENRKPIKFAALLQTGSYVEFVSYPKSITIVDIVLNRPKGEIEITGFGPPPMNPVEWIDRSSPDWLRVLNFFPTIGDFRQFWRTQLPAQGGELFLRGAGGAPFRQPLRFQKLPDEDLRPLVRVSSPRSTYSRTVRLEGKTRRPAEFSSHQESVIGTSNSEFSWTFLAPIPGQMNRSEILAQSEEQRVLAFHEIYRGFPGELSLRGSGVLASELQVVVLAEVAGQWWFESLLGWEHPRFSRQRWGLAAKWFQAVTQIGGQSDAQELIKFRVGTFDLKYRLSPGVWARDATIGLMLNSQTVTIDRFQANMAGAGVFWARSMPKPFDVIFNLLPFMRYPKWVDAEFIYYGMSLSPNVSLGVNTAVNFHGKILWSPRFFGEAGFGLKTYQFSDLKLAQQIGLGALYATFGLGFNF